MTLKEVFIVVLLAVACNDIETAPVSPGDAAALIEQGLNVYKEIVGNLKDGIKGLFIAEEMTNVAKTLLALNIEMGKQQKDALTVILKVHEEALLAINSARIVVTKLKNICDDLIFILETEESEDMLMFAIETYIDEGMLMEKNVEEAVDKLTRASAKAMAVDAELLKLKSWANVKKAEIGAMTAGQIAAARAKAYGGAAACLAAGPFAVIACPIAYGIAAGVTEGHNVKQIQKNFDKGIEQIDAMRTDIGKIGKKTKDLVTRVDGDKKKLLGIQENLDKANRQGRLTIRRFKLFFPKFKASIKNLYELCKRYLSS